MNCPHSPRPVTRTECADIICTATDSSMFALCRQCAYGLKIMATVGSLAAKVQVTVVEDGGPEPLPAPEVTIEPQKEVITMETITAKELFDGARIPMGSRTVLLNQLRAGKLPNGPNGERLIAEMAARGVTLEQITMPHVKSPKGNSEKPQVEDTPAPVAQAAPAQPAPVSDAIDVADIQCTENVLAVLEDKRKAARANATEVLKSLTTLSNDTNRSLEDILKELSARLPEATITIALNHASR